MHVNISNAVFGKTVSEQDEAVRKLYFLINRFYTLFCNLFRRSEYRTGYCGQMEYDNARTMDLHDVYSDHYVCFNLGHYNAGRIELRLVGGQPDFEAFRQTMETVFFLCNRVKTIKWEDIEDLYKVFKGCNQYVYNNLLYNGRCYVGNANMEKISHTVKTEDLGNL